jgi:hypothetical protein
MIASIHQPNYLPYIGFFNKMKISDVFVLLDTSQYVKNDFHNRNRIKGPSGEFWLTIPIPSKQCYLKRIIDVSLPKDGKWAQKHLMSISMNYGKSNYYKKYIGFFERLYSDTPEKLGELNEKIILFLTECFNIKTKIINASEMKLDPELKSTDMLVDILKRIGADTYIAGRGREGKDHYLDLALMKSNSIKLEYHEFNHPTYNQNYKGFVKNLSAIDLLFNCGEKSEELI